MPPELRARVFGFVFKTRRCYTFDAQGRLQKRWEPLLHVSKEVRKESIPVSYLTCWSQPISVETGHFYDQGSAVEKWVTHVVKTQTRHLRYLRLAVSGHAETRLVVCIKFQPQTGLKVTLAPCTSKKRREIAERIETETEAVRKSLGLQGEAIVMAIGRIGEWQQVFIFTNDLGEDLPG
ncbi:hypothetical protein LTR86_010670 [Recurvomyces mirabilis]|nr:hypothetical protein LTR86_010670 [Recurvomyces mirabilis]